jgi:NTP pyrophosphatase (non-canonical NTP hydrolase)
MSRRSYAEVELDVIRWAEARKIIPNGTPLGQANKTLEEAGELVEAAAQMQVLREIASAAPAWANYQCVEERQAATLAKFRDAVGDVVVTLINACALADVDLVDCLADAYDVIKDRKGTLKANGVFVKEGG